MSAVAQALLKPWNVPLVPTNASVTMMSLLLIRALCVVDDICEAKWQV